MFEIVKASILDAREVYWIINYSKVWCYHNYQLGKDFKFPFKRLNENNTS